MSMSDRKVLIAAATVASAAAALIYLLHRSQRAAVATTDELDAEPSSGGASVGVTASASPVSASAAEVTKPVEDTNVTRAAEAQRFKDRGNKRYAGRQFEQAISDYTKAIELVDADDPEAAKFYGNRAQCYSSLEKHPEAERDCDAALRLDPVYVKALVRRATAREKQGKLDLAIVDYTAALLLSDMQHEAAIHGVDRLVKQVAKEKTEAHLQEPMRCLPSVSFIATFVDSFRKIRELIRSARPSTAELTSALESAADGAARAALLVQRALGRMQAREYEDAFGDWASAVSLISALGDVDRPPAAAGPSDAQRQSTLQMWSSADGPSPAFAMSMLGMFLHLRGNYDQAMLCYDEALKLDPKATEVLIKRSSLWFEKEQVPKAFADFEKAIAIDPKQADIFCHRGQLHMLQQDLQKAVTDLKKSVKLDNGSLLSRLQLGMAHHRLKQLAEARAVFQEAEARFPDSPDALNYHGEFLVETGDLAGAAEKFRKALEVSGGCFAISHVNLGVLDLHQEGGHSPDIDGALARFAQAIEADALCETAHVHMAHLMLQQNKWAEAVACFDKALALLRVKQEVEETYAMREAAAAQLSLLTSAPEIYEPVMERQRALMAGMQMG